MDQDAKTGVQVGLGTGHILLDGDPNPRPPKGHSPPPQFLAYICCGKMAGWIKMPHGMKVGLGPCHIVLDGDSAPLPKGTQQPPPLFGPCLLWPRLPISATAELLYCDNVLNTVTVMATLLFIVSTIIQHI